MARAAGWSPESSRSPDPAITVLSPQDALLAALNHLLRGEEWAPRHLAPFAGRVARLQGGPFALVLEITPEGYFRRPVGNADACVTLTLTDTSPLALLGGLSNPASLLSSARIEGAADLADCLGFVLRNLRWDIESDLAPLVGDIAAHRLVRWGQHFFAWQRQVAWNLAANVAEFLTEERPALAGQRDYAAFARDVDSLASPLCDLERRIARLEGCGGSRTK